MNLICKGIVFLVLCIRNEMANYLAIRMVQTILAQCHDQCGCKRLERSMPVFVFLGWVVMA